MEARKQNGNVLQFDQLLQAVVCQFGESANRHICHRVARPAQDRPDRAVNSLSG